MITVHAIHINTVSDARTHYYYWLSSDCSSLVASRLVSPPIHDVLIDAESRVMTCEMLLRFDDNACDDGRGELEVAASAAAVGTRLVVVIDGLGGCSSVR